MRSMVLLFFSTLVLSVQMAYAGTGKIYIFISFSMPKESIKEWMDESQKAGASLVIRGLVNNSFKETIQKMSEFTQGNKGGLQLDPNLFKRFHIEKVPAVVVADTEICPPTITCQEQYDVIYGNVTLAYALKKIVIRQDAVSSIAKSGLSRL